MKLYKNSPKPGYYRRPHWHKELQITWDKITDKWIYTNNGHEVGGVLEQADDFIKIEKETKMKKDVNYIGGEYKIVGVSYNIEGPLLSEYYFKADIDLDTKQNDLVVIEDEDEYKLVRVIAIYENNINNKEKVAQAKAWVVDVVDTSAQDARREATKRRAYIIQQLEERRAQVETINMYRLIAESDPEAAKLVKELESLS